MIPFHLFKNKKINIQNETGENDKLLIVITIIVCFIGFYIYFFSCLNKEEHRNYAMYETISQNLQDGLGVEDLEQLLQDYNN